ncbi:S8 family serine peptidase [Bdellovibrio bacteriovorus]|uniref:S8 family serine peptidase n=1 Tax=Bdellovibrio bacteriovorus TaxID=959 RepID=UPI0035A65FF4
MMIFRPLLKALLFCLILGHSTAFAAMKVEKEKFDNGVVSRESYYQDTRLVERRYFDIDGVFTGWTRFTYPAPGRVIVTDLSVEKESYGLVQTREEWTGLDSNNTQNEKSRLIRKWHFTKDAPFKLEYVGWNEQTEPFREIQKDYLDKNEQLISSVYLYYKGTEEKPYAFIEKDTSGKTVAEFSLYEKYDLIKSLKESGKSPEEIKILKAQRENPDKFVIAIIDSGFDYNHSELVTKWWNNPADPVDGIDNDGNGWVDDNFGWDQVRDIGLPTESTSGLQKDHRPLSHGTHVAHIATKGLNNVGLVGFAGDYTRADYIKKMSAFIKQHKIRLVNMSLGFPADNKDMLGLRDGIRAYKTMIEENPETLFVVASGNAGQDLDLSKNRQYPASFTHPNVLKVGALNAGTIEEVTAENATMADFSNFGLDNVDILAPGVKVNAASLGGGLIEHSGTSMATPYMVNLIVQLWTELPHLKAAEVRQLFIETAQKTKTPAPIKSGGYADLKAALLKGKMQKLEGRSAQLEGPNCWNSATYLAGISRGIHHTVASEFANVLESPLCTPVSRAEAQTGDIIALRRVNRNGRVLPAAFASELHGYTQLGSGMGFTKNGVMPQAPYEVQNTEHIFNKYRSSNGRECKKLGIEPQDCRLVEMAYRCQTLESYMKAHGGLSVWEQEIQTALDRAEKELEERFLNGKPTNADFSLQEIADRIQGLKSHGSTQMVIDYFESRLDSLEFRN